MEESGKQNRQCEVKRYIIGIWGQQVFVVLRIVMMFFVAFMRIRHDGGNKTVQDEPVYKVLGCEEKCDTSDKRGPH